MATTTCADCGTTCPTINEADLNAAGWRLILNLTEDDQNIARWRCGNCWESFKGETGMPSLPPPLPRVK